MCSIPPWRDWCDRGRCGGFRVGYRALVARQGARREISRAALIEVSLVAVPMQAAARVETVRAIEPARE